MGFFDILFALLALVLLNAGIRLVLLSRKLDEEESALFIAHLKMMLGLALYAVVLLPGIVLSRIKNNLKGDE